MALSLMWFSQKKKLLFSYSDPEVKESDPLWRSKAHIDLGEKYKYFLV